MWSLRHHRPLVSPWYRYSEETEKELSILRKAAECRRRFGARALEQTIVSHTETLSDLLEVIDSSGQWLRPFRQGMKIMPIGPLGITMLG
ncbi:phosphoenolpyruvate carboxylase [Alcaligenes faecalis subsp. faecalis NCIB 8687]|nr:phosphoenolpyruvate carboxylase [Alcaligenes faecalis subsp. faecalis NCIB 8687]